MNFSEFIGKTLGELAEVTGIYRKPIRIFVLAGDNDDTGKWRTDVYSIRQAIIAHPDIKDAVISIAYDFYGETILRVNLPLVGAQTAGNVSEIEQEN